MSGKEPDGLGLGCLIGGLSVTFVVTAIIMTPLGLLAWFNQAQDGCGRANPTIACRPWAAMTVVAVLLGLIGLGLGVWASGRSELGRRDRRPKPPPVDQRTKR